MSEAEAIARARYGRTLAAMERHAVDLLLLARAGNGVFASGVRRVQIAGPGGFVPWVVVSAGAPAPWAYTPDLDAVPAWIGERGRPMAWSPARLLDDLAAIAPRARRVAYDVVSPRFLDALAARFPEASWVDGEAILAEARAGKTDAEIAAVAAAARTAAAVVDEVARAATPGATGPALAGLASVVAIRSGATFLAREARVRVTTAGAPGSGAACEGPFRAGDLVTIEVAVFRGGAQGEAARTVMVGTGSHAGCDLIRRAREALDALTNGCRPEATGEEIAARLPAGVRGAPFLLHGIGTGAEPPFLDPAAPAGYRLRRGATVVASVEVADDGIGTARLSRTLAIGADGARDLGAGGEP